MAKTMTQFRRIYDRFLEVIAVAMMAIVTIIVTLGFLFRWAGMSLVWYDEVASISLAWLTYFGTALAALRGSHLGFSGFVNSLSSKWRVAMTFCASGISILFFALLAFTGAQVTHAIAGLTLVSLPWMQQQWVVAIIPITSVLFIVSELLRLPEILEEARRGPLLDAELKEALGEHVDLLRPPTAERTP